MGGPHGTLLRNRHPGGPQRHSIRHAAGGSWAALPPDVISLQCFGARHCKPGLSADELFNGLGRASPLAARFGFRNKRLSLFIGRVQCRASRRHGASRLRSRRRHALGSRLDDALCNLRSLRGGCADVCFFALDALASISAAARSPLASSDRSQVAATSIFFGLGAIVWPDRLEPLLCGWRICRGQADLLFFAVFCRRPTWPG
jgi:hypothetical protein